MKKSNQNLILLLAAAGIGVYLFMQMRRRRGTVSVEDAEIISERDFAARRPSLVERAPGIIEDVKKVTSAIFTRKPKAPKADTKAAPARFQVLAAAAKAAQEKGKRQRKVGSMDNISVLY